MCIRDEIHFRLDCYAVTRPSIRTSVWTSGSKHVLLILIHRVWQLCTSQPNVARVILENSTDLRYETLSHPTHSLDVSSPYFTCKQNCKW